MPHHNTSADHIVGFLDLGTNSARLLLVGINAESLHIP